jgi:hypothetical protein
VSIFAEPASDIPVHVSCALASDISARTAGARRKQTQDVPEASPREASRVNALAIPLHAQS